MTSLLTWARVVDINLIWLRWWWEGAWTWNSSSALPCRRGCRTCPVTAGLFDWINCVEQKKQNERWFATCSLDETKRAPKNCEMQIIGHVLAVDIAAEIYIRTGIADKASWTRPWSWYIYLFIFSQRLTQFNLSCSWRVFERNQIIPFGLRLMNRIAKIAS